VFKLLSARDPVYADAACQSIVLMCRFDHLAREVPFHATSNDAEPHGRDIFRRAIAGEWGRIAAFVPPPAK
jgi:hypothetical protein